MQGFIIEKALLQDLNIILKITEDALKFMKAMNVNQWDKNYPNEKVFRMDIEKEELYICKKNNEILGFICINESFEPDFLKQINFNKNYDEKTFYLHRLAVKESSKKQGVAQELLNFCEKFAKEQRKTSLRADTYSKNTPMNSLFKKLKWEFSGKFYIQNYENPFLAYEKILD